MGGSALLFTVIFLPLFRLFLPEFILLMRPRIA